MVSMARPWLADADFIAKAATGRAAEIAPCIACNQACLDHTFSGKVSTCLVNPRACHETELTYAPTPAPKRVAVVGAGPAGMTAAIVAAMRGHQVLLFDKAAETGGQFNLAKRVPGKEEFHGLIDWFRIMLDKTGVSLRLNHEVQAEELTGFDEIILATGVTPRDPDIPIDLGAKVFNYADILNGADPGRRVAIIGAGGIGFDVAEALVHQGPSPALDPTLWRAEWGVTAPWTDRGGLAPNGPAPHPPAREVHLLQRKAEKPGRKLGKTTGWIHRSYLAMKGVRMRGGVNYERITADGLMLSCGPNHEAPELLSLDGVVICAGQQSDRSLSEKLSQLGVQHHVIGGADQAVELDAKRAIDQGARLAAQL